MVVIQCVEEKLGAAQLIGAHFQVVRAGVGSGRINHPHQRRRDLHLFAARNLRGGKGAERQEGNGQSERNRERSWAGHMLPPNEQARTKLFCHSFGGTAQNSRENQCGAGAGWEGGGFCLSSLKIPAILPKKPFFFWLGPVTGWPSGPRAAWVGGATPCLPPKRREKKPAAPPCWSQVSRGSVPAPKAE